MNRPSEDPVCRCDSPRKLRSEWESVKEELEKVFGPGLDVEEQQLEGGSRSSKEPVIIALAVLLALSVAGLVVLVVVLVLR